MDNYTDITLNATAAPPAVEMGLCPAQRLINDFWVRVALCLCYLVIFVIGFTGNLLVILVRKELPNNPCTTKH